MTDSMELENHELQQEQVRRINDSMRKVRKISRKSQSLVVEDAVQAVRDSLSAEDNPGFYVESPGTIEHVVVEDDTGQFCIPEPDMKAVVTKALNQAFFLIDKERREFRSSKDSPVVTTWRIL